VRIVWVERLEVVAGRQGAEGAGVGVGVRHAAFILSIGQRVDIAVWAGEKSHFRRTDTGGDNAGLGVGAQVVELRHGGVHPWHTAQLLGAVGDEAVDDLTGRHAHAAVAA
jgi:hypothetical protein